MIKDFSATGEAYFIALVKEVEDETWSGITDGIGDLWYEFQDLMGNLEIQSYLDNVRDYHKIIIDKNDLDIEKIKELFRNVRDKDDETANSINEVINSNITIVEDYIDILTKVMMSRNLVNNSCIRDELLKIMAFMLNHSSVLGSPAYADNDNYGGNQGTAKGKYMDSDIQAIVRKYYPEYSDKEISKFLSGMNKEGCSYVAISNTIYGRFAGKEDEFEKIFGFPMYDENGNLNYDLIIVDYYCSKDKKNKFGETITEQGEMWKEYLAEKGVKCDPVRVEVTFNNYEELSKEGEIIISGKPYRLQNLDGSTFQESKTSGHAVTITGVTEDGRFIVSSWGRKLYLDPSDCGNVVYLQVKYE